MTGHLFPKLQSVYTALEIERHKSKANGIGSPKKLLCKISSGYAAKPIAREACLARLCNLCREASLEDFEAKREPAVAEIDLLQSQSNGNFETRDSRKKRIQKPGIYTGQSGGGKFE